MSLSVSPLYTSFLSVAEEEGAEYLGTHLWSGHIFDLYIVKSCVDGLKEILAVPADHESRGPIAMEATLCKSYKEGHPLQVAYEYAKARQVL